MVRFYWGKLNRAEFETDVMEGTQGLVGVGLDFNWKRLILIQGERKLLEVSFFLSYMKGWMQEEPEDQPCQNVCYLLKFANLFHKKW